MIGNFDVTTIIINNNIVLVIKMPHIRLKVVLPLIILCEWGYVAEGRSHCVSHVQLEISQFSDSGSISKALLKTWSDHNFLSKLVEREICFENCDSSFGFWPDLICLGTMSSHKKRKCLRLLWTLCLGRKLFTLKGMSTTFKDQFWLWRYFLSRNDELEKHSQKL